MERRELIQIALASSAFAQATTAPTFFTAAEYQQLDALTQVLLPDEPQSAGARAANVNWYIDKVLTYSGAAAQAVWRQGLTQLTPENLPAAAAGERNPNTPAAHFFVTFKRLALEAYLQSKAGQQAFGYQGNAHLHDFPGCPPGPK